MDDYLKQEGWLKGFYVYFGAWYRRSTDGKLYKIAAADVVTNEVKAQQEGDIYMHWIGTSQEFKNAFTKLE